MTGREGIHGGESSGALLQAGNECCARRDWAGAIDCFQKVLTLAPDHFAAQNNLASALTCIGQWEQAAIWYERAYCQQPGSPELLRNIARACAEQNRPADAIAWLNQLLRLFPEDAAAHVSRALGLLVQGDLARGWPEFEWRWRLPEMRRFINASGPRWDGGELGGRRILLHAEQGLGDAIQCARFVPEVARRGGRIVLAVFREMRTLLEGIAPIEQWVVSGEPLPGFDEHCPLLSLPGALGTTVATIPRNVPYLLAGAEAPARWKSRVPADGRRKIGLCWAGHPGHSNDENRSMALSHLAPLAKIPGLWFCSLQKGHGSSQAKSAPMELNNWSEELHDLAETAALIANLDLVISVDTAVAHLAGALGRPVWLAVPFVPDWRWMLNRADSPWYPTMRIFRQSKRGDWQTPIGQMAEALNG